MNAFRDIDALLRMIAREKEILKFLFTVVPINICEVIEKLNPIA